MKNSLLVSAVCLFFTFAACSGSEKSENSGSKTNTQETAATTYTCPMHPEVTSDKPGKCPVCKMDLVPANSPAIDTTTHSDHQH